jgi:uncharacterized damage-inducible protein DinB
LNNEAICAQFGMTQWFLSKGLEGISHEDSLRPTPSGQTINWLVGHLADARNGTLKVLTGAPAWPNAELARYKRGQGVFEHAEHALPLAELADRFNRVQERLLAAVAAVTPERAAEKAPFSPVGNPNETVGSLLSVLAFHEVYHLGQIGMLRRIVGKDRVV